MGKSQKTSTLHKELQKPRNAERMGKTVFLRERQTKWLNTKWPTLKINTYSNIVQTEKAAFIHLGLYVYIHTYVTRINEKEVKNLKQSDEGYMGGLVGKKWKGVMI